MSDKADLGGAAPAVQEAHRALTGAKVEVAGSDLTVAASYKADFDVGQVVADAVLQVREAAARSRSQGNLKQVILALHNYNDATGRLPIHAVGPNGIPLKNPNEKPLLSWRVALLPYLEQDTLYREFRLNEPWDSAHNKKLIEKMPRTYAPVNKPGKPGYTHLQMVVGPRALKPGMSIPASFPDGTSNTIAVVEAAEPVIWTKPDDVMLPGKEPPKDLKKKFGGLFPGGFNVVMWDGSVRFVRDTVSDRTLGLLMDPTDGQVIPGDW
jgi:prepilin-type processing-associated H-X9-DG protein